MMSTMMATGTAAARRTMTTTTTTTMAAAQMDDTVAVGDDVSNDGDGDSATDDGDDGDGDGPICTLIVLFVLFSVNIALVVIKLMLEHDESLTQILNGRQGFAVCCSRDPHQSHPRSHRYHQHSRRHRQAEETPIH